MLQSRTPFRFSPDDYEDMIKYGILTENDRVELIHGEILEKMAIGPNHAACVDRLNRLFNRMLGDAAIVRIQNPIRLADSEPEPDISLLRPRDDFYSSVTPCTGDALLVIEVSDTTLEFDRDVKGRMYAEAGLPEYWIINLPNDCLEVYRQPAPDGAYADVQVLQRGRQATLVCVADFAVDVDNLL